MGFLGQSFGSRHARRSSKGSIDAGDHLVSKNSSSQNFGPWDWRPGPIKVGPKIELVSGLNAYPRDLLPAHALLYFSTVVSLFTTS